MISNDLILQILIKLLQQVLNLHSLMNLTIIKQLIPLLLLKWIIINRLINLLSFLLLHSFLSLLITFRPIFLNNYWSHC